MTACLVEQKAFYLHNNNYIFIGFNNLIIIDLIVQYIGMQYVYLRVNILLRHKKHKMELLPKYDVSVLSIFTFCYS